MVAKKARKAQEATSSSRAEIYRMRVPSILPSALLKMQKSNSVQSLAAPSSSSVEEPPSEKSRTQSSNESSTGKSVDESPTTRRQSMLTRSNATVGRSNLQMMDDSMLKEEENEDDSDSDDEDEDDDDEDGDDDGEDEGAKTAAMKEALSSLQQQQQQSNPGVNTRVLNRSSSQSGRGRQSSLSPSIIAPRGSISAAGI